MQPWMESAIQIWESYAAQREEESLKNAVRWQGEERISIGAILKRITGEEVEVSADGSVDGIHFWTTRQGLDVKPVSLSDRQLGIWHGCAHVTPSRPRFEIAFQADLLYLGWGLSAYFDHVAICEQLWKT